MLFLELPIINLSTKRIKTEMLFKLSNLNSNLALTLGYLNPALNNWALSINSECKTYKYDLILIVVVKGYMYMHSYLFPNILILLCSLTLHSQ